MAERIHIEAAASAALAQRAIGVLDAAGPADAQTQQMRSGLAKLAQASAERARLLKLLHVGRRELRLDDDTWRLYLQQAFQESSSADLHVAQLRIALAHLVRLGFVVKSRGGKRQPHEWTWVDTAPAERAPLLRKIIKQMQQTDVSLGNQVAYVEQIARQMGGLNGAGGKAVHRPLAMVGAEQLLDIVKALAIHLKRERDRVAPAADA